MIKKILKHIYTKLLLKKRSNQMAKFDCIDILKVINHTPKQLKRICFVVPNAVVGSGGFTSILRLGTYLCCFGYDVIYVSYNNQSVDKFMKIARTCLICYRGKFVRMVDCKDDEFDIVIATCWESVWYAKHFNGYKIYFVQDYEPYFYEAGDLNLLAKKTYEMGFHIVALGEWNKYMINKYIDPNIKIDTVSFPYEKNEYSFFDRDYKSYKEKNVFKLCVYMRETPRRLPGLCQLIVKSLQEKFTKDNKVLQVYYYGEKIGKYKGGKNLGVLSKSELFQLYKQCDFGMVASYTNISLVPYEMLATGLPLIEFKDGTFSFFFDKDDAFLFDFDYEKLYQQINFAIENPDILLKRNERVQAKLQKLSWESTAREFEDILKNIATLDNIN